MVHYFQESRFLAQRPSPLCPKCGSHRTEIIGLCSDQKTTFVRCGACDAHSQVPVRDTVAAPPDDERGEESQMACVAVSRIAAR